MTSMVLPAGRSHMEFDVAAMVDVGMSCESQWMFEKANGVCGVCLDRASTSLTLMNPTKATVGQKRVGQFKSPRGCVDA